MTNYFVGINNKNVIVTGGLGFVGHNLVKILVDEYNCKVSVIDNCLNSSPDILGPYLDKVKFIKCDCQDLDAYKQEINNCNFFFHLACVQISASSSNPVYDLQVNALSTLLILEYFKKFKPVSLERFVYTSSASVYGSSMRLPLHENSYPRVLSNYAASKLLGENYTLVYGANYDIPVSVVRYSNVYGYGQSPTNPYCGVLGRFIHNALNKMSLPIIGDGQQTRDYTFVTDAVKGTILSSVHPMALNDVFNLGTGIETSVSKLAEIIGEIIPEIDVLYIPERDIDNIRRRVVDIEKIHQRLRWTPTISIKEGIRLTIDSFRN